MDFESRKFEADGGTNELPRENAVQETSEPEENKFYDFLEAQGYTIDRNNPATVATAIEEMRQTDAFEAAPRGIEVFQAMLQEANKVEQPQKPLVDPVRLEAIATWLRGRGEEFSAVDAEDPRSIVEAFKLQKAIEAKDKALVGDYGEVDHFFDAPVGIEDDIKKLEAAL